MLNSLINRLCFRKRAIVIAGESNIGLCRKKNEDNFIYVHSYRDRNALLVVADGIGGHADGEIASLMCCNSMVEQWRKNNAANRQDVSDLKDFMKFLIETANAEIFEHNQLEKRKRPMGCTVVVAILTPEHIIVGHAGDSRCYGAIGGNPDSFSPLTADHTLRAAVMSRTGNTTDESDLPPSNIICKAVGPSERLKPDVNVFSRCSIKRVLLCSDGLTGMVDDEEIALRLCGMNSAREITDSLMCSALKNGGKDNITIITAFC